MKKTLLIVGTSFGLLAGGFAFGRFFDDASAINGAALDDLPAVAFDAMSDTADLISRGSPSAIQISQAMDEVGTALQLAQIRQNTEIIRLLRKVAGETK